MGGPEIPDSNVAAMEGVKADLKNYPFTQQIDALAKMGGKATINGKTYDFTGLGDADNAKVMSDKMAQTLLDIQKNYGADYVKQRLADLKQSDPTGYAARQQLFDKILSDADKQPNRPLAEDLQNQINSELSLGGKLDKKETEQVQQGVRGQQLHNGIFLGNAPASQEASSLVKASQDMETQRQQEAMNYLKSGASPEDVEYRRIQQSLQNLGAAVNGQTPTAEFASLSGAQNGAAPFNPGQPMNTSTNPNAALQGLQSAYQQFGYQTQFNNNQVNPFLAGIGMFNGGMGVANQAGLFANPNTFNNTALTQAQNPE